MLSLWLVLDRYFRACEHAYNLLETTFLPLFYQSDDVSTCKDKFIDVS